MKEKLISVLIWILKWPVVYGFQIVNFLTIISLIYLNLFPDDPLNLPSLKHYLLAINAYAFGTTLRQIFKYVTRQYIGRDGQGHVEGEEQGD